MQGIANRKLRYASGGYQAYINNSEIFNMRRTKQASPCCKLGDRFGNAAAIISPATIPRWLSM